MPTLVRFWGPDTCGCEFDFTFDTDGPADALPGLGATLKTCPDHGALSGVALFDAAVADNQRKNGVWGLAEAANPALKPEDFEWSFGPPPARVLTVTLTKLSVAERGTLLANATARYGAGAVVVV